MRKCRYCHKPCTRQSGKWHDACRAEFVRRGENCLCMKCGGPVTESGLQCYDGHCLVSGNEGFVGYSGK